MSDRNTTLVILAMWSIALGALYTGNSELVTGIVGIFGGAYGISKIPGKGENNVK